MECWAGERKGKEGKGRRGDGREGEGGRGGKGSGGSLTTHRTDSVVLLVSLKKLTAARNAIILSAILSLCRRGRK